MRKTINHLFIFFVMILCNNFNYSFFNPRDMWEAHTKKQEQKYIGEKPVFCQQGFYKDGKFVQFTVDEKALCYGVIIGAGARVLLAVANCGTKFETFKSSVVRPGIAKSVLFWGPTIFVYNSVIAKKEKEGLREKLARIQAEENGFDSDDDEGK